MAEREPSDLRIKWSTLRSLGQSKALSFAIAIPILGFLILFNRHVIEYISLAPELVAALAGGSQPPTPNGDPEGKRIVMNRLYLLYFGFSFTGIASFLFLVFCPPLIRRHDSAATYVIAEKDLISRARITRIALHINKALEKDTQAPILASEMKTLNAIHRESIVEDFHKNLRRVNVTTERPSDDARSRLLSDFDKRGVCGMLAHAQTPGGYLLADAILNNLLKNPSDLMELEFAKINRDKPFLTASIALLYSIGFIFLLAPSIWTFYRVARYMVSDIL